MRNSLKLLIFFVTILMLPPLDGQATTTRYWTEGSADAFMKGKARGVAILSDGRLVMGVGTRKLKLGGKAPSLFKKGFVYRGRTYAIAGLPAGVWEVRKSGVKLITSAKGEVLFTDAVVCSGRVYVSAVPSGTVYTFDGRSLKRYGSVPSGHALSLACAGGSLYVGTGPDGILYRMESGRAVKVWKSPEKHLLSLLAHKGVLYVGTGPEARLYSFDPVRKRGVLLYDFGGNEITAMAVYGDDLYVAANSLKYRLVDGGSKIPKDKPSTSKGTKTIKVKAKSPYYHPISGVGFLMRLTRDRAATTAVMLENSFVTSVFVLGGTIYLTTGGKGAIYAYDPARSVVSRILETDERHILWATMDRNREGLILTGDGGAAYRIGPSVGKEHVFESKVHDAGQSAVYGTLRFRGAGVVVETRTGMSDKPDDSWTEWRPVRVTKGLDGLMEGRVQSPAGRFFQYRVRVVRRDGWLSMVRIFYATVNLPPRVEEISFSVAGATKGDGEGKDGAMPDKPPQERPKVKISWVVDNPDGDSLWYRVWIRRLGQKAWFDLTPDGPVTDTSLQWEAGYFPDGLYQARVWVSDEPSNPQGRALSHEKVSEPFLVDNHPPKVTALVIKPGGTAVSIKFAATDSFSRITGAAVRVDSGKWVPVMPSDGLFDTRREEFLVTLKDLRPGYHLLQVRVRDEGNNITTVVQQFRVAK